MSYFEALIRYFQAIDLQGKMLFQSSYKLLWSYFFSNNKHLPNILEKKVWTKLQRAWKKLQRAWNKHFTLQIDSLEIACKSSQIASMIFELRKGIFSRKTKAYKKHLTLLFVLRMLFCSKCLIIIATFHFKAIFRAYFWRILELFLSSKKIQFCL